jgi:hypothetical protein
MRRKDRADGDEVRDLDVRVTKSELERRQAIFVNADAGREEHPLRNEEIVDADVAQVGAVARGLRLFGH